MRGHNRTTEEKMRWIKLGCRIQAGNLFHIQKTSRQLVYDAGIEMIIRERTGWFDAWLSSVWRCNPFQLWWAGKRKNRRERPDIRFKKRSKLQGLPTSRVLLSVQMTEKVLQHFEPRQIRGRKGWKPKRAEKTRTRMKAKVQREFSMFRGGICKSCQRDSVFVEVSMGLVSRHPLIVSITFGGFN